MNGAESLVRTLVASGVEMCFANPGTSEMHFVAALDHVPGIRCALGLAEGVVTGAADGYARLAEKPAATLLHLGPGLANGLSNLHNARKANSPIINVVGEHATYHLEHDSPLASDVDGIARPLSHWMGRARTATDVAPLGAQAVAAARTGAGQIATLILPANTAWDSAAAAAAPVAPPALEKADEAAIRAGADLLKQAGSKGMLLMGGRALLARGLEAAGRIQAVTGCRLSGQGSNARITRHPDLPDVGRIPFVVDQALAYLADVKALVLVGARNPVAFFAYPGKPSLLAPADCELRAVAPIDYDLNDALERMADYLGAPRKVGTAQRPPAPMLPKDGPVTLDGIAAVVAALIPDDAVVVDESITSGRGIFGASVGSRPHDWLQNMGGSIGYSLPVAVGAALAAPNRKILTLTGDGSAFYTLQALWSMARDNLDVTVVVFANRRYAILRNELNNVGAANPGPRALDMLTLDRPDPDWVKLAEGHGVQAERATDIGGFARALANALAARGPRLVELVF